MLRILIIVFLLLLVYRIVRVRGFKNSRRRFRDLLDEFDDELYVDPVCGREVPRKDACLLQQNGQTYGFCSQECQRKFHHDNEWKM